MMVEPWVALLAWSWVSQLVAVKDICGAVCSESCSEILQAVWKVESLVVLMGGYSEN